MWYLYRVEFYAAMKKNEMLSFAGKDIVLSLSSLLNPGAQLVFPPHSLHRIFFPRFYSPFLFLHFHMQFQVMACEFRPFVLEEYTYYIAT
jgi:hypothetical protein